MGCNKDQWQPPYLLSHQGPIWVLQRTRHRLYLHKFDWLWNRGQSPTRRPKSVRKWSDYLGVDSFFCYEKPFPARLTYQTQLRRQTSFLLPHRNCRISSTFWQPMKSSIKEQLVIHTILMMDKVGWLFLPCLVCLPRRTWMPTHTLPRQTSHCSGPEKLLQPRWHNRVDGRECHGKCRHCHQTCQAYLVTAKWNQAQFLFHLDAWCSILTYIIFGSRKLKGWFYSWN